MKYIFELPFYSQTVGGITATIALAKELNAEIRFQSVQKLYPHNLPVPFTVGKADNTFPECDVCITYSDNPYAKQLLYLPQIKRVACYFQSYGMSYANEHSNANHTAIINLCSTKKIEYAIKNDGLYVDNIGFGLDMQEFVDYGNERKNYLAIMYHDMPSKKYDIAVRVADLLYSKGIIDGVISFGMLDNYKKHQHPKGLVAHYGNATKAGVADVFNQCKAYLMPSVSEGLNLTPIESTLCGCPAVICDGAINEIFVDNINCIVVKKNDIFEMANELRLLIENYNSESINMKFNMQETIKGFTWSNVANKIKEVL